MWRKIRLAGLLACNMLAVPLLATAADDVDGHEEYPAEGLPSTPREAPGSALQLPFGEGYVGVFGGNVNAADTEVVGTRQCYFCPPVTDRATLHFSGGPMVGLRAGLWGRGSLVMAGIGLELSTHSLSADNAKMEYQSHAVTPMLRIPLWRSATLPGGRVTPYAGLVVSRVKAGDFSLTLPGLPAPLSGAAKGGGSGGMLGVALRYRTVALQIEYRAVRQKLAMDSLAGDEAELTAETSQALLGINYLLRW